MILTENDLVCLFAENFENAPENYLKNKSNVISKGFYYYSVDNDKIKIISGIENSKTCNCAILFFNNLTNYNKINIVDTMHGVLEDCYVDSIEFINRSAAPEIHIEATASKIYPWTTELDVDCYNIDESHQGLMSMKPVTLLSNSSIFVDGVYLDQGWSMNENLKHSTLSYNIKINRSGRVEIKQMFYFKESQVEDPSHINIINNLKSKIFFKKGKDNNVSVSLGFDNFYVDDIKIDDLNYVYDIIDLPTDFRSENIIIYRLYYSGNLIL